MVVVFLLSVVCDCLLLSVCARAYACCLSGNGYSDCLLLSVCARAYACCLSGNGYSDCLLLSVCACAYARVMDTFAIVQSVYFEKCMFQFQKQEGPPSRQWAWPFPGPGCRGL